MYIVYTRVVFPINTNTVINPLTLGEIEHFIVIHKCMQCTVAMGVVQQGCFGMAKRCVVTLHVYL